jgi:AbrB family looped-hinge helix DNA binding protein
MYGSTTITGKQQITIPADLFRELGLKKGDRLEVRLEGTSLVIEKSMDILNRLVGSIKVPEHLRGIDPDVAIREAKMRHFGAKQ